MEQAAEQVGTSPEGFPVFREPGEGDQPVFFMVQSISRTVVRQRKTGTFTTDFVEKRRVKCLDENGTRTRRGPPRLTADQKRQRELKRFVDKLSDDELDSVAQRVTEVLQARRAGLAH